MARFCNFKNDGGSQDVCFIHTDQSFNNAVWSGSALTVTTYPSNGTNNAGYIAKFGTSDSAGGSMDPKVVISAAYNKLGFVGIGTTSPATTLDVSGTVQIRSTSGYAAANGYMQAGSLSIGDILLNYGGGSNMNTNTAGFMMECLNNTEFAIHDAGNRVASFMYYSGNRFTVGRDMGWGAITSTNFLGSVGIGTASPATTLDVNGTITTPGFINVTTHDPGDLISKRYASADRYGIGQYTNGVTRVFTSGTFAGSVRISRAADDLRTGAATFTDLMTVLSTGNVGIGTTSPGSALEVNGVMRFTGTSTSLTGINLPTGGAGIHWGNGYSRILDDGDLRICTDDNMHFYTGCNASSLGTERITLLNSGNVGIGTNNPSSYTLQVSGTIGATGDITAFFSDDRLKTKTGRLESALEKVLSLEAFTYVPNDLAKSFGFEDSKQRVGLSAQSVQRVLPEAVCPAPFDAENQSGQGYLTVQYDKLVPLLVEAIKELAGRGL
jgi:hypothetical protein